MYAFGSHGSESRGGRAVRGTIAVFSDAEKPAFVRMHGRRSWPFLAAAEKETTAGAHHFIGNFVIGKRNSKAKYKKCHCWIVLYIDNVM